MSNIPTLIVIDDCRESYQLCCYLKQDCLASSDKINLDLFYSRSLILRKNSFSGIDSSESCITFDEISSYLSSENAPENLIIILDLGFNFGEEFHNQLHREYFSCESDFDGIKDDMLGGLVLGSQAIKNRQIKNLMIFYATTRGLKSIGDKYLEKKVEEFCSFNSNFTRKITYYGKFSSPFFLAELPSKEARQEHAKKFVLDIIKQWESFSVQSQAQHNDDNKLNVLPQFELIVEGRHPSDPKDYPTSLVIKISRTGTNIKKVELNNDVTVKFARIIYEAILEESNFISYLEICEITGALPTTNKDKGYDGALKENAAGQISQLLKRLKMLNIFSNSEKISLLLRADSKKRGYTLVNFTCKNKLQ